MTDPLRPARRHTDQPDPAGWSAADVPDDERVDDDHIHAAIVDPATPVRSYEPLQPDQDRLFPPVEED